MKSGGGKTKGSGFERKICKLLSLWYSEDTRDDIFFRSASSGAMATQRFKKGKDTCGQSGDITSTDTEGIKFINKVSIECKHYKSFGFEFLLFDKPSKVSEWWIQADRDAFRSRKMPLLIIKRNNVPEVVILKYSFKLMAEQYCGNDVVSSMLSFYLNGELVCITTLDKFLNLSSKAIKMGLGI